MRRLPLVGLPIVAIAAVVALVVFGGLFDGGEAPADVVAVTTTATATPTFSPTLTPTATATPVPRTVAERYAAAIRARDGGDPEAAAEELRTIAAGEGPLAPFAAFRLAQVLASIGEHDAAVDAFTAALDDPVLPRALRPIAREEGARALVAGARVDEAIAWLTIAASDPAASASQQWSARWARAELLLELEDPAWSDDALALVAATPGHPAASRALDALEAAAIEAPELSAAYTRYLARENGRATERYDAILEGEPDATTAGIAWFYRGALAERLPDRPAAIAAYAESLAIDPVGSRADDAAYWRGRVAEEEADFEAAAAYYDVLTIEYAGSGFAGDGALRGALAMFEAGDEAAALERLGTIARGGGTEAATASRWYDLIAGPDARIEAAVPSASEIDPRSHAAILETAGPAALDTPIIAALPTVEDSQEAIAGWLIEQYGVSTGTSRIDEDDFVEIASMLLDAGERSLARALFLDRVLAVESDPHAVIGLSTRAQALGLPDVALILTMRLLGGMSTEERLETPLALERLAYPAAWPELVSAASEEFGVPPLLLLALIRQESAFEPDVVSPAGAIGLTQVIPPTGTQIAAALEEEWGGVASLTDPTTALRYGAYYLATQLETFDGNVFAALAAYNAGPTNAQRWLDSQASPGADGYIQTIDFEETRRYVTGVIEQYGWYRYVYGVADRPAIR